MKKKLLLVLVAGFVTVASAKKSLDCTNNTTNQCCIDVHSIQSAIVNSPTHAIKIDGNLSLVALKSDLTSSYRSCVGMGGWSEDGTNDSGLVEWQHGDWVDTIFLFTN